MTEEQAGITALILLVYVMIGGLCAISTSENDSNKGAFVFALWPVAFTISIYRGFRNY